MSARTIQDITADISRVEKNLQAAKESYAASKQSMAKFAGHQSGILVAVGGVRVDVTYNDRETGWSASVIRGREMILLGVQKVLFGHVDACEQQIKALRRELQEAALQLAVSAGGAA